MDATNEELIQRIVELEEKLAVYEKKEVSIYGLVDPRDNVIRYVGQSVNPENRLIQHIDHAANYNRDNISSSPWIRELLDKGIRPTLTILDRVSKFEANDREAYWIGEFHDTVLNIQKRKPEFSYEQWINEVRGEN